MSDFITLSYSNGTESAMCGDVIISSNLPIGTWLTELLNSNLEDISNRISSCEEKQPRSPLILRPRTPDTKLLHYDPLKFPQMLDSLVKDYPNIFSLYKADHLHDIWSKTTFEFCRLDDDNLIIVNTINEFKEFLEQLMDNSKLFSFDFLDYLNTIGAIPPFSVSQCVVVSDHHEEGKRAVANKSLSELYDIFSTVASRPAAKYQYPVNTWQLCSHIIVCSILELARQGKTVKKCQNCGKYFIPTKRSDTLYCDNPSPMAPEMTCKEYGARRLWYEKQKEDDLATLSRKIASAKGMLAKRNPDIPEYTASYDYFKEQRLIWIKAVKNGTKTQDEYRAWLELMQKSKVIKEALNSSN